jgi:hypothetical protein
MTPPAHINNRTLNNARVNKWKNAKPERPIEIVMIIIRPNWLRADRAKILLKSNSELAPRPTINTVNPEINNKITFNQ